MVWKVLVTPIAAILWGAFLLISLPLKKTLPESIFINPVIQLIRVVFPDPLGPIIPRISPSFTSKLTPFRAWTPPKALLTLLICKMGSELIA
jgi:hypothetical protein